MFGSGLGSGRGVYGWEQIPANLRGRQTGRTVRVRAASTADEQEMVTGLSNLSSHSAESLPKQIVPALPTLQAASGLKGEPRKEQAGCGVVRRRSCRP